VRGFCCLIVVVFLSYFLSFVQKVLNFSAVGLWLVVVNIE